ncbi:MAG TPA: nucleoside phosphorylase [Rectinemataceae bacterium]
MPLPRYPGKFQSSPFFNPSDFLGYIRGLGALPPGPPPKGVILSYQSSLSRYVMDTCATRPAGAYFDDKLCYIDEAWAGSGRLALASGFGIGAPAAAVMLEELIAWGVEEFVSLGTAGSLRADLPPGSLALCTGAFRDEGTSWHYMQGDEPAAPDPGLTSRLESALMENGLAFSKGPSWTIDAIYRETPREILGYRDEGALVVEMEASALFAVAAFRKKPIAACFSVSDTLAELSWRPEFHASSTKEGLQKLFHAAVRALL